MDGFRLYGLRFRVYALRLRVCGLEPKAIATELSFSSDMPLRPVKPGPQALASCVTYYRRISLMTMFGLNAEDDDGNAASGDSHAPRKAGATPAGPARSSAGPVGTDDDFLA